MTKLNTKVGIKAEIKRLEQARINLYREVTPTIKLYAELLREAKKTRDKALRLQKPRMKQ